LQQALTSERRLAEAARLELTKKEGSREAEVRAEIDLSQSEQRRMQHQRDAERAAALSNWRDQQAKVGQLR